MNEKNKRMEEKQDDMDCTASKKRKIHLDVQDCMDLASQPEGVASLTDPSSVTTSSKDLNRGLYPRPPREKRNMKQYGYMTAAQMLKPDQDPISTMFSQSKPKIVKTDPDVKLSQNDMTDIKPKVKPDLDIPDIKPKVKLDPDIPDIKPKVKPEPDMTDFLSKVKPDPDAKDFMSTQNDLPVRSSQEKRKGKVPPKGVSPITSYFQNKPKIENEIVSVPGIKAEWDSQETVVSASGSNPKRTESEKPANLNELGLGSSQVSNISEANSDVIIISDSPAKSESEVKDTTQANPTLRRLFSSQKDQPTAKKVNRGSKKKPKKEPKFNRDNAFLYSQGPSLSDSQSSRKYRDAYGLLGSGKMRNM